MGEKRQSKQINKNYAHTKVAFTCEKGDKIDLLDSEIELELTHKMFKHIMQLL